MKHSWENIQLKDVLSKSTYLEEPISAQNYNQVGIQLWGKGAYARESIDGANTGYKYFNKLKYGDVVVNKIWARNGATSVIFDEFEGYYVSTEFPVFHLDKNKIDPRWMLYATQQKWFWDACNEQSYGTSGKNRIKPERFLEIEIPLPLLSVQQQIVSKIEGVKTKLDQIKELRAEQTKELNNLLFSKYTEIIKDAQWLPMKEVAPIIRRDVKLNEKQQYPELGIRCFGKGTFHKPALTGVEVGTKKIFQIKEGDLVFSNVFAWEGGIAVAQKEDNDRYGSHRFISCVVNNEKALADFLFFHFLSPKGLEDINACSPGGAGRNKTLGIDKLMKINAPVPTLALQQEFVALLKKINSIKEYHKQTEQELTELMPSLLDKAFKGELMYAEQEENLRIAAEPTPNYLTVEKSNIPENKKSFAKQVLGGKIVSLFREDKYFTHIKFQKLQYIAEHIIEEDLNWNYYRQAAGPYDNKFMHSVILNLLRNKWFEEKEYKFYPLEKATDIDNYYQNYFGNKGDKLNMLFGLLKNASEKFCEAVATIYAVWNNHIIQNQQFNKEKIKTDFFAWSNRKENLFTDDEFEKALLWMQKNCIEPTGFGQLIKERK